MTSFDDRPTTFDEYQARQNEALDAICAEGSTLGFVYGTLRPGFGNYAHFADCITEERGEGTISGLLYASGIPFLDADGDGTVRGNLFVYDATTDLFRAMARMELGAGYEWRVVTVTLDDGSWAEAGVWHDRRASERGDLVPTGDFNDHRDTRSRYWA